MRQRHIYAAIREAHEKKGYPIELACKLLHAARSAYHKWASGIVGGFIQAVEPFEDPNVLLLCNEEAKLLGLPENRFLRNRNGVPYDIIHGTFFLAQGSGEEFCSLTDKQIQTYTRLYSREKLFVMQHGKVINQPKKGKSTHER